MEDSQTSVWAFAKVPLRFLIEIVVGIVIFSLIGGGALLLQLYVQYLEQLGASVVMIYGMTLAEYVVFLADLVLFLRFVYVSARRTWPEL